MQPDEPIRTQIIAFLDGIGIPVRAEPLPEGSFLPGVTVRRGAVVFDPANLTFPGDLLHEAGHIAVTDPAQRAILEEVRDDPGEEMAATAWSYAAARAIGIDPAIVFHHDFKGGAEAMLTAFGGGGGPGIPMLAYYGMTAERHRAAERGMAPYPAMTRWLR